MKLLVSFRNKFKEKAGFSLLEIMLTITISMFLLTAFIRLSIELYKDHHFFNLVNAWQLDLYLAADFIAGQIKNSTKVEIIKSNEINIYTFYDQEYQWLKFSIYQSKGKNNLGRSLGSNDINLKHFGRNLSLLDDIYNLEFKEIEPGLIQMKIIVKNNKEILTVSKLIKI